MVDHEPLVKTYGTAVYAAARALHAKFREDGARYDDWTLLQAGSVEWWCMCVVRVLDKIHEVANDPG